MKKDPTSVGFRRPYPPARTTRKDSAWTVQHISTDGYLYYTEIAGNKSIVSLAGSISTFHCVIRDKYPIDAVQLNIHINSVCAGT